MGHLRALFNVAGHSLRFRLGGVLLTVVSVALSVFVLLAVEHVRQEARTGFASSVSGVDLIVGARTGEINLLLLSVFRIGNATSNISPEALDVLSGQDSIEWIVPVSLGDSHRGFRVVGTTVDYFERYQYGRSQSLQFSAGRAFAAAEDIVLGSEVARQLRYSIGNPIVLSHGVADESFHQHDQQPFAVSGILAPTGTPIDNALFASLQAIDAIHDDGAREPGQDEEGHHDAEAHDHGHYDAPEGDHTAEEHGHDAKVHTDEQQHHTEDHEHEHEHDEDHADAAANENGAEEDHPADDHHAHDEPDANHQEVKEGSHHADHRAQPDGHDHDDEHPHTGVSRPVTALLVGVNSPFASLRVQRWINEYTGEPLLAILPGVALAQLWELVGTVEDTLRGISLLVFVSALFGMVAMLLASMRERGREIGILRSIGAPSLFILGLLVVEALLIVTLGIITAIAALLVGIALVNNTLAHETGMSLSMQVFYPSSMTALGLIYLTTLLLSLVPAWRAYRISTAVGAGSGQV